MMFLRKMVSVTASLIAELVLSVQIRKPDYYDDKTEGMGVSKKAVFLIAVLVVVAVFIVWAMKNKIY